MNPKVKVYLTAVNNHYFNEQDVNCGILFLKKIL
jgi:hypothetical protein